MKMNCLNRTALGLCMIAASGIAQAEDGAGPKISSEVRASVKYNNHGLEKVQGGHDPMATTTMSLERVKLQLKGQLDSETDYRLRLSVDKGALDYAYGTWWVSKMFGIRVGQDKVQQGGIYNMTNGLYDLSRPVYDLNKPFDATTVPMVDFELKAGGDISLQFFDDKSKYNQWHDAGEEQQPATAIAYSGNMNGIKPRVQVGAFDNNHSHWTSVGCGFDVAGADGYVNYIWDHRSHKDSTAADKPKDKYDVLSSIELDTKYKVSKAIEPFLHFSMFNRKQEGTDLKVNTSAVADGKVQRSWNDNGMLVGIGSFFHATEHAAPFVAIERLSGDFQKLENVADTVVLNAAEKESRVEVTGRVGLAAEF
jgi:hypothetical protein